MRINIGAHLVGTNGAIRYGGLTRLIACPFHEEESEAARSFAVSQSKRPAPDKADADPSQAKKDDTSKSEAHKHVHSRDR